MSLLRRRALPAGLAVSMFAGGGCSDQPLRAPEGDSGPPPDPPTTVPTLDARFVKVTLHREFHCEGAALGDIDRDGITDVVAGPDWYAGPAFTERHPIWPRMAFDPKGYSDCFFQFVRDLDADGWLDVLVVGFPGAGAVWYRNPRAPTAPWARHEVAAAVDNESPELLDLTGDGNPELLFMTGGRAGWAAPEPSSPTAAWSFHAVSDDRGYGAFTHGLGAGDIDGDGRVDVMEATGYFLQPPSLDGDPIWSRREQAFGSGGAQMATMDVDGDGDADVVTTLAAHGYGLAWFEQTEPFVFVRHDIVSEAPPAEGAEVILHEPHAMAMADIDADGLVDVVTGERFWGHVPEGDPDFGAPARLYWFRLEQDSPPRFTPTLIDDDSGVGTQVVTGDANGDERVDLVIANKKGAFVFLQVDAD